jgi:hypothetical protein
MCGNPGCGLLHFARLCEVQLTGALCGGLQGWRESELGAGRPDVPLLSDSSSLDGRSSLDGTGSPGVNTGENVNVYTSAGTLSGLASGAAARLRWLLLRGIFGVHGGVWWRREGGRLD